MQSYCVYNRYRKKRGSVSLQARVAGVTGPLVKPDRGHDLIDCWALAWALFQELREQLNGLEGQRDSRGFERVPTGLFRGQKGRFPTENGVQENPKRPNIGGLTTVLFPSKDFWWRVLDRALHYG